MSAAELDTPADGIKIEKARKTSAREQSERLRTCDMVPNYAGHLKIDVVCGPSDCVQSDAEN